MKISLRTIGWMAALAVVGLLALPSPVAAQDWNWGVTPYAWFPGAGVDVKINDTNIIDGRTALKDLATNIKMAAAFHLEGQKGTFGLILDANYIDLGNGKYKAVGSNNYALKTDLKLTVVEAAGVWQPSGETDGFGLIYGVRIFNWAQTVDLRNQTSEVLLRHYTTSPTLLDGMVGFRYVGSFAGNWKANLRFDYSAGGTKYAWNGIGGIGYSFDDAGKYTMLAGYRYMYVRVREKNNGGEVETDLALDGPYLAFRFGF